MKSRHLTLSLAVALGLASPSLSAMGLGPLQVKSGLNQPLVAEIPIISATPSELEQLDVRLASPEAFARIGLDRPGELTANLQFSIGENSRGQPVILVTTPGRFSEPLLNFLIEAEWGKGTVTREYTALIDPPYIASAVVQPMQAPAAPPVVAPPIASPVVQEAVEPVAEPAAAEAAPAPAPAEPEPAPPMPVAIQSAPAPVPLQPAAPPPEPVAQRPEPVRPVPPAPTPEPEPVRPVAAEPPTAPAPAQYGPVSPGQNLWNIANSVRPDPSISVNQMMVALLRANPEAFDRDNINRLKQGSVLRVPGQDEASRLSAGQAAALVSQQASAWRTPRQPVPQPVEIAAAPTTNIAAVPEAAARPSAPAAPARSASRLEIVPPSGNAAARGAQSGAAAGAGGTELRAELVHAREDLAAKDVEVTELRSRLADLEKQDADRQRLIEMQNSQMKELQDRLAQVESAPPATAPTAVAAADAAPAEAAPVPVVTPWYLNPFVLGGAVLVMLGGMVLAMRRSKPTLEAEPSRRISDDEGLRASMAKTREAGERIKQEPSLAAAPIIAADPELDARLRALAAKPHDLETHLSLLRLHHSRGNAVDYELAAQVMRGEVGSTMDPRWREAVVMGASLMPGHALFGQAGWNSPRFNESPVPAATAAVAEDEVKVFEHPDEPEPAGFAAGSMRGTDNDREMDFGNQAAVLDETFGDTARDVHRDEARMRDEDESSATRIELAKAYLDIGDLDGARSMLEDVLAEGGPTAKAEAGRLLREIG